MIWRRARASSALGQDAKVLADDAQHDLVGPTADGGESDVAVEPRDQHLDWQKLALSQKLSCIRKANFSCSYGYGKSAKSIVIACTNTQLGSFNR